MHLVLQNTFLLGEIFEHLGEESNIGCYNASLVCHDFRDPAQNILWRKLNSIGPLLKLLPNFKLKETLGVWIFEGDIITLDLETLLHFGRRVRTLDCGGCEDEESLHPSVPIILGNALAGQSLLPNLQHLNFYQSPGGKYCCPGWLNLLHSTNLRTAHLQYHGIGEELAIDFVDYSSFILRLHKASSLHTLRAHGFLPNEAAQKAVGSFRSLSTINLTLPVFYSGSFHWAFFTSITALQNLRSLEIRCLKFDKADIKPGREIELSRLQSLSISCQFSTALDLLQTLTLPALQWFTFYLELFGEQTGVQFPWTEFFKAMSVSFGPELSRLEVYEWARSRIESRLFHSYTGVPFSSISCLLLPMRLCELKLIFPIIETISIDDLHQMSKAWPTLTTLHLWTSSPISAPNTSAFSLIAQTLPQLEALSLRLNTSTIVKPSGEASFHKLERISLQPINWPRTEEAEIQLASLLDSLFPYLKQVHMGSSRRLVFQNDLFEHILLLQEARKSEQHEMLQSGPNSTNRSVKDARGNVELGR